MYPLGKQFRMDLTKSKSDENVLLKVISIVLLSLVKDLLGLNIM